jgi:hypothetical protein
MTKAGAEAGKGKPGFLRQTRWIHSAAGEVQAV